MYNPSRKSFRDRKLELGNSGSGIFLVLSGIRQICDGETARVKKLRLSVHSITFPTRCKSSMDEKIEIVCSVNGLPITYWLEIGFFYTNKEKSLSCLSKAIKSKMALLRDT